MIKLNICIMVYLSFLSKIIAQVEPFKDPHNLQESLLIEDSFYESSNIETETVDETLYSGYRIDINTVTEEDLRSLPGIHDIQVAAFMEHRKRFGHFLHICELQTLAHWNIQFIELIIDRLECKPPSANLLASFTSKIDNQHLLFWRFGSSIQQPEAYTLPDSSALAYQGGMAKHFVRWRYRRNKFIKAGITLEKDAGERFVLTKKTPLLFDYYSWFIQIQPSGHIFRNIIAGDFNVHMGQGLIRSNAFGGMASTQAMSIMREGASLRPYTSAQESNAMRGLGLVVSGGKQTEMVVFASIKRVDARTSEHPDSTKSIIHSLLYDGYHRTLNEWKHLKEVGRMDLGFIFKKRVERFRFSWQALGTKLSGILKPPENLHNTYAPRGNFFINTSADYLWYFRNSIFFGEAAMSANGGLAFLQGCIVSPDKKTEIAIAWRHYGKAYQTLNAQAFGMNQEANNERGIFSSIQMKPKRNWTIGLSYDAYIRPWAVFGHSQTSFGSAGKLHVAYTRRKKYSTYLQYQYTWKQTNQESEHMHQSVGISAHRWRAHVNISVSGDWELRSRIEGNTDSIRLIPAGFVIFQDVIFRPEGKPFSATARYAIFEAEDFSNRVYAYENNLLYSASTIFYYGRGSRFYINCRWKINKYLTVELRYASTWQDGVQGIGEGSEKIAGNQKSEMIGQLRLSL